MTKEEIEQKAEEYADKKLNKLVYCSCCQNPDVKQAYIDGYKQGYEKGTKEKADMLETFINVDLEKENEELKKAITEFFSVIEKMKNMQNCKHNWETKGQCVLNNGGNCICNKWELAE